MKKSARHIAIITSTRADWGLLSPVAQAIAKSPEARLSIVATNMHLDPQRGMTVNEIEADGFTVARRVAMPVEPREGDVSGQAEGRAMAQCLAGMVEALAELKPDIVLLLGDRFEMLAAASAASILRIPIAHIAGGETTEGAIDDNFRHAITQLSSLHFPATEPYRQRIIAMGKRPETVINAGALGNHNILNLQLLSRAELEQSIGFSIAPTTLLLTFHPATLDPVAPTDRFAALLAALDRFPDVSLLFTYPNNDPGSEGLIEMINRYAADNPGRVNVVPSLGRQRYLSMLHYVAAVVGNSSSGVVEVPSAKIPSVDIGVRQKGRVAADSVIHCGDSADEIASAIAFALSPEGREKARAASNPYARPDTLRLIVDTLLHTPL